MTKAANLVSRTSSVRKAPKPNAKRAPAKSVAHDLESWLAGYDAGACGYAIEPPRRIQSISRGVPGAIGIRVKTIVDRPSWLSGYIEGAVQRNANAVTNNIRLHGGEGANSSDYCGIGTTGYSHGFKQGMRLAAGKTWRMSP